MEEKISREERILEEYLLQKFPRIGIIILLAELFWGIAVGILDARDGKDSV